MDIAIYVSLDIFLFVGQDALLSELRASWLRKAPLEQRHAVCAWGKS